MTKWEKSRREGKKKERNEWKEKMVEGKTERKNETEGENKRKEEK